MKIEELTPGFRLYDVSKTTFMWYDYLCPMPVKNPSNEGNYFILIDKRLEEPVRMYKDDLNRLLENGIFTLDQALDKQIELAEDWVKFLKEKRNKGE
jgi:hypothetical protein